MTLTVGDKVVYPGRGPCLIGAVVEKMVCGRSASYYRLALLDDSRAELFVPVDKSHDINMRALLTRLEIPKLLEQLCAALRCRRVSDLSRTSESLKAPALVHMISERALS